MLAKYLVMSDESIGIIKYWKYNEKEDLVSY